MLRLSSAQVQKKQKNQGCRKFCGSSTSVRAEDLRPRFDSFFCHDAKEPKNLGCRKFTRISTDFTALKI
jgi:hypothetical protein